MSTRVQRIEIPGGGVSWLVTGYEEGRAALADPRLSKDPRRAPDWLRHHLDMHQTEGSLGPNMLDSDPPDHTRLRQLVKKAFTPRRVEGLRPRIHRITGELLDAMAPQGTADLINALAFPLPVTVICELLGLPLEDRDDFRTWTAQMAAATVTEEDRERSHAAGAAMRGYIEDRVKGVRRDDVPEDDQPDLLHALVSASGDEGRLSHDEVVSMLMLLLIAGHETTVNLIGNGMAALFGHPDQMNLLRQHPELLPQAIEELLRFDGPVQHALPRVALEDMEIGGTKVPAGSVVSVALAAANRDPARIEDPNRLDVTRSDGQHLAFGHGIHFCLGAPLARLEGQIAIGGLLTRFPDLRPAVPVDQLQWRAVGGMVHALNALPVRFTPS
jgi:cytochrome P450